MTDIAQTLVRQRGRIDEIVHLLARYGFAEWAARGTALEYFGIGKLVERFADPEIAHMTEGERLRALLTELGPTWMKFGQMLSLRPDVVGPETAKELEALQTAVTPDPFEAVAQTIRSELGPVDEVFATFDPKPIGSGSIAQVHRATLPDGTAVAVKVLHAGADAETRSDLELMQAVADYIERSDPDLARFRPSQLIDEFQTMMLAAVDLSQELLNLQRFAQNFAAEPDIVIPRAFPDVSSTRVLTMELIEGATFKDAETVRASGWDLDALVQRATNMYLEMIFRDGVFHADPHPGNFLLPDSTHLAILDFGDVGFITGRRREQLEDLVIAIGTNDEDALTSALVAMTKPPADLDRTSLRSDLATLMNRNLSGGLGQIDLVALLEATTKMMYEHHLTMPSDMALLVRVLARLQGLGRSLDVTVPLTELIEPYVAKMMENRFSPARLAHMAMSAARSWEHLLRELPDELTTTLERLRSGHIGVDFRVRDEDHSVDQLVDGLVASASLLASAQLLARRVGPTVRGVSVPGVAAFVVGITTWQRQVFRRGPKSSMMRRAREVVTITSELKRRPKN